MADKKWFRVTATSSTTVYAFVQAENEDDAYKKARWDDEPDAGDYIEQVDVFSGDWSVDSDPYEVETESEKKELQKWLDNKSG